ncbi:hypothetical protein CSUI_006476 [Cystoisospora suis]|uniref:Transmembrane protein n=1 Tax=Cystoisospora suis TaxID=483139 RepID=A0A2C6KQ62_9APIC|nr:hypothetical protein CSUI_006476 [Cystoisospora suis]
MVLNNEARNEEKKTKCRMCRPRATLAGVVFCFPSSLRGIYICVFLFCMLSMTRH